MKHSKRGFSLVEMLVALLVISIGLLGIAKMQALALSNTSGGRVRAIAVIEAGGLASVIASNHNYWGTLNSALSITVTGGSSGPSITSSDATLSTSTICLSGATGSVAPCSANQMAAYDLQTWATEFRNVMGINATNYFAQVNCSAYVPPSTSVTYGTQVTCTITVNWTEQNVSGNSQSSAGMASPTYTLLVNP